MASPLFGGFLLSPCLGAFSLVPGTLTPIFFLAVLKYGRPGAMDGARLGNGPEAVCDEAAVGHLVPVAGVATAVSVAAD